MPKKIAHLSPLCDQRRFRKAVNVALCALAAALYLLVLQNPTVAKVGGGWCHTGNLLHNPDASSSQVSPPWTFGGAGNWLVQSGPVTLGSFSINSSDGSPWFLDSGNVTVTCATCFKIRTATLTQTVNVSAPFQTNSVAFEYGGDAFAIAQTLAGNGVPMYYFSQHAFEVSYRVDFLSNSGNVLAWDDSGPIFNTAFGCPVPVFKKQNYGVRRSVGGIPAATRAIRFTATVTDRVTVCDNYSTTCIFKNGFDNLWLQMWVSGCLPGSNALLKQGSTPGHIVNATLVTKPSAYRSSR